MNIPEYLAQIVVSVENGNRSPLEGFALIKTTLKECEAALKEIEAAAIEEARQYGQKSFQFSGFEFQRSEGRRLFDFKTSPAWNKKKAELTHLEERMKAAWNMSQKIGGGIASMESGEEIELPAVTYSKESLSVKAIVK